MPVGARQVCRDNSDARKHQTEFYTAPETLELAGDALPLIRRADHQQGRVESWVYMERITGACEAAEDTLCRRWQAKFVCRDLLRREREPIGKSFEWVAALPRWISSQTIG